MTKKGHIYGDERKKKQSYSLCGRKIKTWPGTMFVEKNTCISCIKKYLKLYPKRENFKSFKEQLYKLQFEGLLK